MDVSPLFELLHVCVHPNGCVPLFELIPVCVCHKGRVLHAIVLVRRQVGEFGLDGVPQTLTGVQCTIPDDSSITGKHAYVI